MKTLVIAEKPSVAESLARVLQATQKSRHYYSGGDYIVTWSLGHLLTLKMPEDYKSEWQEWSLDTLPLLPDKMQIKPLPKTRAQLKAIGELAKRQDIGSAVIATDAGREGELVARWILDYLHFDKPVKRLWISSQTDKAVRDGFAHFAFCFCQYFLHKYILLSVISLYVLCALYQGAQGFSPKKL